MKIKSRLAVGGLFTGVICALAGSITGTVAWYTYSTKVSASYQGVSAGAAKNLELAVVEYNEEGAKIALTDSDYKGSLVSADLYDRTNGRDALTPATNGKNVDGKQALNNKWFKNPKNGYKQLPEAVNDADYTYYRQFTVNVRAKNVYSGDANDDKYPDVDIYLADIAGEAVKNATKDVSAALRMHIAYDGGYALVAPGVEESKTTKIGGEIAGMTEPAKYQWEDDSEKTKYTCGETYDGNQVTLAHEGLITEFDDEGKIVEGKEGVKLGTTNGKDGLELTFTIWLEGWDALEGKTDIGTAEAKNEVANVWDPAKDIGVEFNVGFKLQTEEIPDKVA